ncbi:hypothetical protein OS965_29945 [Streptomyces sp. H27-G5]|uniref:hypothetical protein n=1 Tax=Streptomyces sp. H27-G5 TaxID=2996698 RepID=UPI00226FA538|nr:hypothetical protein [Streptomyces sp. H27-G5]MCY0922333.1 hypothetical protein [Streptomyces sp. H27-G5]
MTRRRLRTAHRLGTGQGRISLATTSAATADAERNIDWIAVELAVNGELPARLTRPEQIETARLLTAKGMGPTDVGLYLGITKGTIRAWRDKGWKVRPVGRPAKAVR